MRVIGVDLDNTLVCYDGLFHCLAHERQLIPPDLPATKLAVREHLRRVGAEPLWTELQGTAYGAQMSRALAFPAATAVLRAARASGIRVVVISHRTRQPYAGEAADLHDAARQWLRQSGFFDPSVVGLQEGDVFLEVTQEEKCRRIAALACDVFIDDLPEVLDHVAFPRQTRRILFDPRGEHSRHPQVEHTSSWLDIGNRLGLNVIGAETPTRVHDEHSE